MEKKCLDKSSEQALMMIVHDLKGPVGEIMANLAMLGSHIHDETGAEILLTALNSTTELLEMVMNIVDVGRFDGGKFTINRKKFDLVKLLGDRAEKAQGLAMREAKTLRFDSSLDKYEIDGDKEILGRVFWNLLSNANNHTTSGCAISISVDKHDDGVMVCVTDDGVGIPYLSLERIFDKFYQSDSGLANKYSSGLGLAFCKMAVEAHGGKITAKSSGGHGATFIVHLP